MCNNRFISEVNLHQTQQNMSSQIYSFWKICTTIWSLPDCYQVDSNWNWVKWHLTSSETSLISVGGVWGWFQPRLLLNQSLISPSGTNPSCFIVIRHNPQHLPQFSTTLLHKLNTAKRRIVANQEPLHFVF